MYGNQPMWRFLSLRIAVFTLDLMRWSQLTAALSIWGFMIFAFLVLAFVTAEHQGADPLGIIFEFLFRLPFVGTWLTTRAAGNYGTLTLSGNELKTLALQGWTILSVIAVLLEALWLRIRKNSNLRKPRARQAIFLVVLACATYFAAMTALMIMNRELFNGPTLQWVLTFFAFAVVLFVVGTWAVLVSRAVTAVSDYLLRLEAASGSP